MAKAKKTEPKIILEREYIVPLRHGWLKVPKYKRANKAVKTLKEFIARHMKVYDRDLKEIRIDINLNNEIRFRGMKKPPAKIKVKAEKYDNGIVKVYLVDIPEIIKYKLAREKKKKDSGKKKKEEVVKPEEPKPEEVEESKETEEKKEASKEEGLTKAKMQAKEQKHVSRDKGVKVQRKALSR